jgi:serine/threonine-protein kinase RsbW
VITQPPKLLVIKSEISELEKVENFINEILKEYDLDEKYFNRIYVCVSEAVLNSIKHGNKNDKNKTVSIGINCNMNEINVLVEDEGKGFNINKLKDPTLKENLKNESGRGIFIIKNLSDKLEYNEKGNRIQFKIKCQ